MTLQQLFAWCNQKSYFSRDEEEVWAAINTAALQLYTEVLNENRGYFWVFDAISMTLVANTEEYTLPATVENLCACANGCWQRSHGVLSRQRTSTPSR